MYSLRHDRRVFGPIATESEPDRAVVLECFCISFEWSGPTGSVTSTGTGGIAFVIHEGALLTEEVAVTPVRVSFAQSGNEPEVTSSQR